MCVCKVMARWRKIMIVRIMMKEGEVDNDMDYISLIVIV